MVACSLDGADESPPLVSEVSASAALDELCSAVNVSLDRESVLVDAADVVSDELPGTAVTGVDVGLLVEEGPGLGADVGAFVTGGETGVVVFGTVPEVGARVAPVVLSGLVDVAGDVPPLEQAVRRPAVVNAAPKNVGVAITEDEPKTQPQTR
jgi:hypothetical protein